MSLPYDSLVVLTTGKQDRGARATLAFSWACSALALGKRTAMFLTMDGTVWGIDGTAAAVQVQGFEPLSDYIETFRSLGGAVLVCAPCTEYYCAFAREDRPMPLIDGAELAGLATVVAAAGPSCTVVTF
jgi:predicted peroxiredoxin